MGEASLSSRGLTQRSSTLQSRRSTHTPEEEELAGMQEENLEEHMVDWWWKTIASVRSEEQVEHPMVKDSFETLHKEGLHAFMLRQEER
jgi:hypothetical protein